LLAVSFACFVVGSLVFALTSDFSGLLVGRAIQGIGGGMVTATCNPVMARALAPGRLGRAAGIFGAGWGLGTIVGLLIFSRIEAAAGYRAVFFSNAGLALLVGAVALSQRAIRTLPKRDDAGRARGEWLLSLGTVAANPRVLLVSFTNTALLAISVGILAWTPSFLQDIHGSTQGISIYLVAGVGAAQLISNPLGAVVAGRLGKYVVVVASLVLMAGATILIPLVPGVSPAVISVIVAGFFSMFFFPSLLEYLSVVVARPEHVGPATGINCIMGFAGSLVAPWIFGLLLDAGGRTSTSYLAGYLVLASFGVAATIGMVFFGRLERRLDRPVMQKQTRTSI
jgi:MFS transporter, DHA1 family, multidrug resistance protein